MVSPLGLLEEHSVSAYRMVDTLLNQLHLVHSHVVSFLGLACRVGSVHLVLATADLLDVLQGLPQVMAETVELFLDLPQFVLLLGN
jgi:hypothetical protein